MDGWGERLGSQYSSTVLEGCQLGMDVIILL